MKKRIYAWLLLIGFALLIINLLFGFVERGISLAIYVVIALAFIFSKIKTSN